MVKDVMIGDKTVAMAANAASPIFYKKLFHKDMLRVIASLMKTTEEEQMEAADTVIELAFLLAATGEHRDMSKISEADYISWLEGFELMDILAATDDIVGVYFAQTKTDSEAKKN